MAQLSEFDRSYSHVLLYPPQPAAMVTYDGRQGNFSAKMILNFEFRIHGSEFKIYNSEFIMHGSEFTIHNSEF